MLERLRALPRCALGAQRSTCHCGSGPLRRSSSPQVSETPGEQTRQSMKCSACGSSILLMMLTGPIKLMSCQQIKRRVVRIPLHRCWLAHSWRERLLTSLTLLRPDLGEFAPGLFVRSAARLRALNRKGGCPVNHRETKYRYLIEARSPAVAWPGLNRIIAAADAHPWRHVALDDAKALAVQSRELPTDVLSRISTCLCGHKRR